MTANGDGRNPVEVLAEEFQLRRRRGEPATPEEYAEAHPELADEIRALFPALMLMEDLGGDSMGRTGSIVDGAAPVAGVAAGRLGDFRLLREVGRGGMGIVYEAEQESLGRRVALKVLPIGALNDPRQVQRFEREARSAAKLHYTNIVPVFGVGREGDTHYYVMQFIAGQGLDLVLEELKRLRGARSRVAPTPPGPTVAASRSRRPAAEIAQSLATGRFVAATLAETPRDGRATATFYPPPEPPAIETDPAPSGATSEVGSLSDTERHLAQGVARIGLQVAEALAYAHGQGILHRDIKPSNLLLDRDGNVWVADFGLAKAVGGDDLTHTGDILGTIRYMAPERFQGQSDARADVYSLGLTLYELLALRPAFVESDRAALIRQVTQEDPQRLRKVCRSVPADLETIIHKAIAREPNHRYSTATALSDDLKRFLDGRPIKARRVSIPERTWRWCRRNPSVTALLVLLVAALGGMAGLWMRSERHLSVARRHLTGLELDRALALCERGDGVRALAGLAELLRDNASSPADEQFPIRANVAAWSQRLVVPETLATDVVQAVYVTRPKAQILAIAADGRGRAWDVDTGRPTGAVIGPLKMTTLSVTDPTLKANYRVLDGGTVLVEFLSQSPIRMRCWDVATGRALGPPIQPPWSGFYFALDDSHRVLSAVKNVNVSKDSVLPVTVELGRWSTATGLPVGELWRREKTAEQARKGWTFAMSLDGNLAIERLDDEAFQLWDLVAGRKVGEPLTQPGFKFHVVLPARKAVAMVGRGTEPEGNRVRLWSTETGRPLGPAWEMTGTIFFQDALADASAVFCFEGDRLTFRDLITGEPRGEAIKPGPGFQGSHMFSDDRKRVVTWTETEVRVWDLATRREVGKALAIRNRSLLFVNRDGTRVAVGDAADRVLDVWDVESGTRLAALGDFPTNGGWGISGDGSRAIALDSDSHALRRWDFSGVRREWSWLDPAALAGELPTDAQRELRYQLRFAKADRRDLDVLDATGRGTVGPRIRLDAQADAVTLSPKGDLVLTGSRDGVARLWSVANGQPVGSPMPHAGPVAAVAFTGDARMVVTASGTQARFWDVVFNRPIGPALEVPAPIKAVVPSGDGRSVLVICDARGAYRWPLPVVEPGDPAALVARYRGPGR